MADDRKYILSQESVLKIVIGLISLGIAYGTLSNKIDSHSNILNDVKSNQIEMSRKQDKTQEQWQTEKAAINLEISTCKTQIEVLNQQIKDMQDAR